jgi:LysR family transcriptional regulator, glycine cleavage system transcriptional activator
MQRRLPPLNALRAFEAAARHCSITKAAAELCVTQSAVSRQISLLEAQLQQRLFVRAHRAVTLTDRGAAYLVELRSAFDAIEEATRRLQVPRAQRLRIKLPPTFAIRWLIPRLARLHALDRSLDVQITTSHAKVDFEREDIDVAIHSGTTPAADHCERLFGETLLPACSPDLLPGGRAFRSVSEFAGCVLLCSLHRPDDWPRWIARAAVANIDGNSGLQFENSSLAYQAAIDRLGIVMAQHALIADDLATGRLAVAFPLEVQTDGSYHLVYPQRSASLEAVRLFAQWIGREAEPMRAIA